MPQSGSVQQSRGGLVTIVGHGPSVRGAVADDSVVVRLKDAKPLWGTRTDFICARAPSFARRGVPFWHFAGELERKWTDYFHTFDPRIYFKPGVPKPSTGLCAVFCAVEFLKPDQIALIGFDAWFGGTDLKWNETKAPGKPHDFPAELRCARSLARIINLSESCQNLSRMTHCAA
jgi:hypothetical protein